MTATEWRACPLQDARQASATSIGKCGHSLGAALGHGRVLRVRGAADPAHPARTARAGRRAGRARRGRRRQLRGPRVRRPVGDAHASGPPPGRRPGRGVAAARRGVRRGQPPRARHRPQRRARPRATVVRRSLRRTRRAGRGVGRARSRPSARTCGPRSANRPGSSPPSAPDPASRSPRSPRGWPSPTASAWCAATRKACCCKGFRCGGCGASARWPRRSCTGSASKPSAPSPPCPTPKPPTSSGPPSARRCTGSPAASTTGPSPRTPPPSRSAPNPRFPEDLTTLDQLREAAGPIGEHAHARLEKDGRGARTVTVKLKKSDMSTLTRSATLPYATTDAADPDRHGPAAAARSCRDRPDSPCRRWFFGPVRCPPGVAVSGSRAGGRGGVEHPAPADAHRCRPRPRPPGASATTSCTPSYGHGWIQGAGHGVMTVRFETRSTGPGPAHRSRRHPGIARANPVDSLDWPDYLASWPLPEHAVNAGEDKAVFVVRLAVHGALMANPAAGPPVLQPMPSGSTSTSRVNDVCPSGGTPQAPQLFTTVWLVPSGASRGTASQPTGPPLGPIPHDRPSGVLKYTK